MLTFKKGNDVKYVDEKSELVQVLKSLDWVCDTDGATELDVLREKAESLGLKPHHKAGVEKLKELIASAE